MFTSAFSSAACKAQTQAKEKTFPGLFLAGIEEAPGTQFRPVRRALRTRRGLPFAGCSLHFRCSFDAPGMQPGSGPHVIAFRGCWGRFARLRVGHRGSGCACRRALFALDANRALCELISRTVRLSGWRSFFLLRLLAGLRAGGWFGLLFGDKGRRVWLWRGVGIVGPSARGECLGRRLSRLGVRQQRRQQGADKALHLFR